MCKGVKIESIVNGAKRGLIECSVVTKKCKENGHIVLENQIQGDSIKQTRHVQV